MIEESAAMMQKLSTLIMMAVWSVFTLLPAFLAFIIRGKGGWWFIAFLGALSALLNGFHSIAHMAQGDIFNGGLTFVIQMVPLAWAVVWSFKHAKTLSTES
jgi:hypothetical protein